MEDEISVARRIVLCGCTGSGKSTAARTIGELTGLPVIDEDALIWRPGWEAVPHQEQVTIFAGIAEQPAWVIDGDGPGGMMFDKADLILLLDYPRWLSFQRLLRRCIIRTSRHIAVCNGNYETWRQLASSNSILRWHARTWMKKRQLMRKMAAQDPERVLLPRRPSELKSWIGTLAQARPPGSNR